MMRVDVHEAEARLASLIDKVKGGEEVRIIKEDTEVKLVLEPKNEWNTFPFGILKGMDISDWDDPLPSDIAELFGLSIHQRLHQ